MPGSHRIRRQRWQVRAPDRDTAFAWRRQLRGDLDSVLLPAFERAFDGVAGEDEVIRIPYLEVQLTVDDMDQLAERLPAAIAAALARALDQPLPREQAAAGAPPAKHGVTVRLSQAAERRAALLHYLASGNVDWPQAGGDSTELAAGLRRAAAEWASDWDEVRRAAPDGLGLATIFFIRLLQLLAEPAALRLLSVCRQAVDHSTEPSRTALQAALRAMSEAGLASHEQRRLQAVELAIAVADAAPAPEYIAAILAEWLPESALPLAASLSSRNPLAGEISPPPAHPEEAGADPAPAPDTARQLQAPGVKGGSAPASSPSRPGQRRSAQAALPSPDAGLPPAAEPPAASEKALPPTAPPLSTGRHGEPTQARPAGGGGDAGPAAGRVQAGQRFPDPPGGMSERLDHAGGRPEDDWRAFLTTARAPADEEASPALRIHTAGLILLHPFILPLFRELGVLAEDGKSLPAGHLARAAALLHWLATGREDIHEFELGCIKVLLGLAPTQPLPVDAGLLDETDRAECAALLAAAVAHWPALRSTSTDALRLSFLQRRGLLRDGDSGWLLQVEPEAFDLLLSRLPWGISIVKLPWMTRPIFTDWPTP